MPAEAGIQDVGDKNNFKLGLKKKAVSIGNFPLDCS
jgi:hypothetical protein